MAQKTRSQLKTQSDGTFLDNATGQIIPANHRDWNDDTIDSAAMVGDDNTLTGSNTFTQKISINVGGGMTALESLEGGIYFENGGINLANGGLDVGGHTNLNTAFVRKLQNCFDGNIYYINDSGPNTLNLTSAEGNIIYIEGDGEITSYIGEIGTVFYAICIGNSLWNGEGGDVEPAVNFKMFPNDILIFMFTGAGAIRVIGRHRATGSILNGQNFFTIDLPADALFLQDRGYLDVGATYKVIGAYEMPKSSGFYHDVFLRAKTPNVFEPTCYLADEYNQSGVLQKALFYGDFSDGGIRITDTLDASEGITFAEAETNNSASPFALEGARAYVNDPDVGFYGYVHFASDGTGGGPQIWNLLDQQDINARVGRIMNTVDTGAQKFISDSGAGFVGTVQFGSRFFTIALPSLASVNSANLALGVGIASVTNYRLSYQIVNNICSVRYWAEYTGSTSVGNILQVLLPTPFTITANNHQGYGTLRFLSSSNSDTGALAENYVGNQNYFLITSKHANTINNQNFRVSGCITFEITT